MASRTKGSKRRSGSDANVGACQEMVDRAVRRRQRVVDMVATLLREHVRDPAQLAALEDIDAARNIEIGIYNATVQIAHRRNIVRKWSNPSFGMLYVNRARTIYANLLPTSYVGNTRLITRLARLEFLPHQLAFMSPLELCPERWQDILDDKQRIKELKSEVEKQQYSTLFYCRKCHQRKTTYYQMQTRSADEPMTVFITCQVCNNKWRM